MDVIILQNSEDVAASGAGLIQQLLQTKPDAVLGLATGNTPIAMYQNLITACDNGDVSFRGVTTFNLDEYVGINADDPASYRTTMKREFFDRIDIDQTNTYLPECAPKQDPCSVGPAYEATILEAGGIDLQVLGIGENGHIGFNEPTSSLGSRTRIKTLTRGTLQNNSQYFSSNDVQPQVAVTMGIATILDARHVVLLATGSRKADAVRNAIEGPVSAMCPASAMQMHEKVTVLLDNEAASRLVLRDYYDWVHQQKQCLGREFTA